METLLGGIILVVSEKYEFDYRNKTVTLNIFSELLDFLTVGIMMERSKVLVFLTE